MIIDSHTHIGKLLNSPYSESCQKNLELLLRETKENKIDHLVILAGFKHGDDFNISTENLLDLVKDKEGVHVIGSIDILEYKEDYLGKLDDWLSRKLIKGVKLYPGYQHFYPNEERCKPVYELCLKHDVPVIFHSGDVLIGYVQNPKIKYSHPIHVDDVATDFPDLKIVIAHMGNPWQIDCAELLYKNPNVYADISGLFEQYDIEKNYEELMRRKIKDLVSYTGAEHKLMYGTDWPLFPMKSYLKFVKSLGLRGKELDNLLYGNAVKVFKL